ncbi:hypothetical protein JCM9140_1915 [Halalkalibacter wakoensis JCM 9140]|uniref:Lia operon protein LiaI n=1 Tax=Halalkalibacter wakoensis JCM 9140 TaxID=1236970 RepID=W4Q3E1_9BACI|nr:hypothetical protein [Halalkalibacter wakoensis]GAE25894.1 hypothetical protein JCM9140_1915 [Halalkalibacter wakoensis JCM 9140]
MNKGAKVFGGILLIFIGVNILLGMIGINVGGLLGLLIGGGLLYWGYSKWQETGKWSFSSILLVGFGALLLLGGLGGIIGLIIGALLVYGGYKLIKSKEQVEEKMEKKKTTYDTIDEEFTKLMKEGS